MQKKFGFLFKPGGDLLRQGRRLTVEFLEKIDLLNAGPSVPPGVSDGAEFVGPAYYAPVHNEVAPIKISAQDLQQSESVESSSV